MSYISSQGYGDLTDQIEIRQAAHELAIAFAIQEAGLQFQPKPNLGCRGFWV